MSLSMVFGAGPRPGKKLLTDEQKKKLHAKQGRKCKSCGRTYALKDMEVDHKKSWAEGGPHTARNAQLLCTDCNRTKGKGTMADLQKRLEARPRTKATAPKVKTAGVNKGAGKKRKPAKRRDPAAGIFGL